MTRARRSACCWGGQRAGRQPSCRHCGVCLAVGGCGGNAAALSAWAGGGLLDLCRLAVHDHHAACRRWGSRGKRERRGEALERESQSPVRFDFCVPRGDRACIACMHIFRVHIFRAEHHRKFHLVRSLQGTFAPCCGRSPRWVIGRGDEVAI